MTKQQRDLAYYIIDSVASVNPYNRLGTNSKDEYNVYQTGFLASYLASLMSEDHIMFRKFQRHIDSKKPKKPIDKAGKV
jgi:hypothetical protein